MPQAPCYECAVIVRFENDTHKDDNIAFVFKAMALPGLRLFVHAA